MERNEELRAEFKEIIESYPQQMLYYVDECGIDTAYIESMRMP